MMYNYKLDDFWTKRSISFSLHWTEKHDSFNGDKGKNQETNPNSNWSSGIPQERKQTHLRLLKLHFTYQAVMLSSRWEQWRWLGKNRGMTVCKTEKNLFLRRKLKASHFYFFLGSNDWYKHTRRWYFFIFSVFALLWNP